MVTISSDVGVDEKQDIINGSVTQKVLKGHINLKNLRNKM